MRPSPLCFPISPSIPFERLLLFNSPLPHILSGFPMNDPLPTSELFKQFVVPTYGRFNLQFSRGEGVWLWDEQGKRYLDFGAGIAVTSLGHCHPRVNARMAKQLGSLVHTSNLYYTRPQGELAKRLVEIVGHPGKIFFCNSGAEANEALYKLARKFGNETLGFSQKSSSGEDASENHLPRRTIITMHGSFHGRTLGGIAATGQDKVKKGFDPLPEGFRHGTFNDIPELQAITSDPSAVAILVEPVQGERGIYAATPEFLQKARSICDERSMLLMFDEVQCGLGRTGDWNGWDTVAPGVTPDAVSWAKGIAGGFPLGAVWISDRPIRLRTGDTIPLCDLLGPGSHGTTFGGTPLICEGALEVLSVIEDENLLQNAKTLGKHALESIRALKSPWIQTVRGVGLMIGIELVENFSKLHSASEPKAPSVYIVEKLHEAGLMTVPSGTHTIRWLPALNVDKTAIDEATSILSHVLNSLGKIAD